MISVTQRKPSCGTTKLTHFAVSKDKWKTKEDTGKSINNVLYVLQYAKGTSWAEVMSKGEEIESVSLSNFLKAF